MELLLKTFSLSKEEFENYNKKSTAHVKSYYDNSMDKMFIHLFNYLEDLNPNLSEYCEFGVDKCHIENFKEFCDELNIDIVDNLSRIIKEYYHIFENKHEMLHSPKTFYEKLNNINRYNFYNRDRSFMFTCTSHMYMKGSLSYFGCTGEQKHVLKAFEMIYNNGNNELCYGGRDYV